MVTWPDTFPDLQASFVVDAQAVDVRSKIVQALQGQRHRRNGQTATVKVGWMFTHLGLQAFSSWHKYRINGGADWFLLWLPISTDANEQHRVRFQTGIFNIVYQEGERWLVTATLDVQALLADVSEASYDAAEAQLSGVETDDHILIDVVDAGDVVTTLYRQD